MNQFDRTFVDRAIVQALKSAGEGGVPVGAALAWRGVLVAEGQNRRVQDRNVTSHGETDCLKNAGMFGRWQETTLYTTLSPCMMCAGTIVQLQIPRVVVVDNVNFGANEDFLRSRGVVVDVQPDETMIAFFADWKKRHPDVWNGGGGSPR
jgi:creatinine deaminase